MPFLTRLAVAEPFETWPGMEQAAAQRFWDALALATGDAGHEAGAIYLFGYVAEMLLKTAYFRVTGVPPSQDIAPHLMAARRNASWRGGNLHDLRSWFALLNDARSLQGNPWGIVTAAIIDRHVLTVASHWRESLRYSPLTATDAELEEVLASVDWLLGNYNILWR